MFNRLKDLVFGLGEFDRTRFDIRFELIFAMVPDLKLKRLEDFELLEESISKLKELLRIKSSNLNRCITNSSRNLKKNDVLKLIKDLNGIKYAFLRKAFYLVEQDREERVNEVIEKEDVMGQEAPRRDTQEDEKEPFDSKVFENQSYSVRISNGAAPYLLFNFKGEIDFSVLKFYEKLLYEEYGAEGSNVIVDEKRVLLVPRFEGDQLFELPRVESDLEEIFAKLLANKEKEDEDEDGYYEVSKKAYVRKGDDSLDDILGGDFKKEIVHPNPRDDDSKPEFLEGDKIVFEKKEPEVKKPEVEVIRDDRKSSKAKRGDEQDSKEAREELKDEGEQESFGHELFRDDKVVIYLRDDSKVIGEICLKSSSGIRLEDVEESDLSYMMMFAKAFSSILFESVEAHGTNIIMDYNDDVISIIPRFQEDKVGLSWDPLKLSEEDFEGIKEKLVSAMMQGVEPKAKKAEEPAEKEEKKAQDAHQPSDEDKASGEEQSKKKAEHILESLYRIP